MSNILRSSREGGSGHRGGNAARAELRRPKLRECSYADAGGVGSFDRVIGLDFEYRIKWVDPVDRFVRVDLVNRFRGLDPVGRLGRLVRVGVLGRLGGERRVDPVDALLVVVSGLEVKGTVRSAAGG
jgi:hypothetical protein